MEDTDYADLERGVQGETFTFPWMILTHLDEQSFVVSASGNNAPGVSLRRAELAEFAKAPAEVLLPEGDHTRVYCLHNRLQTLQSCQANTFPRHFLYIGFSIHQDLVDKAVSRVVRLNSNWRPPQTGETTATGDSDANISDDNGSHCDPADVT